MVIVKNNRVFKTCTYIVYFTYVITDSTYTFQFRLLACIVIFGKIAMSFDIFIMQCYMY